MSLFAEAVDWYAPALLTAAIAAIGYVAKLLLELWSGFQTRRRLRRARLVELHSLLRASHAAFRVQCENRDRLLELIRERLPELAATTKGYEKQFVAAYPTMTDREKELHLIVRSITEHTIQPLNQTVSEWLKKDDYFRSEASSGGTVGKFATQLEQLEVHLLLWHAKYKAWIPGSPHHALVYMGDEEQHGVIFPKGIEAVVEAVLKHPGWFGP